MKAIWALVGVFACWMSHAAEVSIYDRATGKALPTYRHHGKTYVAGEPGHEYEIRLRSQASTRMLAVTTVDGVNVITGETGATSQSGYVIDPYGFARVEGWRKSMTRTAAFYFTRLPDSYAARTGRPENVGVIGVALFRERDRCCDWRENEAQVDSAKSEQAASVQRQSNEAPPSPSSQERRLPSASDSARAESKLGTGHGRNEFSAASYTNFERASERPDETIVIYYDSRRNLLAQGVIPAMQRYANKYPQPFPNGFVPDP